jgi:UDP-N-acetylmuramate dehydrogenase
MVQITDLPLISGEYRENFDLSKASWFGCGGCADVLFKPKDEDDLSNFLSLVDKSIPIMVLGAMSNTLVRDCGFRGVVIKLGRAFTEIKIQNNILSAGASVLDVNIANFACQNSITGFEFLIGVPGTIGGNVVMNAGCYGGEISQIFSSCVGFSLKTGEYKIFTKQNAGFAYRSSKIKDIVITKVDFFCNKGEQSQIELKLHEINLKREQAQPLKQKTCGSTFTNPSVSNLNPDGKKAWELVRSVIPEGYKVGGAFFSPKHHNFIINDGTAKASDIETLGETARLSVLEKHGINLEWEIKIVG